MWVNNILNLYINLVFQIYAQHLGYYSFDPHSTTVSDPPKSSTYLIIPRRAAHQLLLPPPLFVAHSSLCI